MYVHQLLWLLHLVLPMELDRSGWMRSSVVELRPDSLTVLLMHWGATTVYMQSDGSLSAGSGSTSAPHSSIFSMHTVVVPQCISRTINESGLSSNTLDIV